MSNYILCPRCYAGWGGEEKCCSHGCADGIVCVKCRTVRDGGEHWSCLGSMADADRIEEVWDLRDRSVTRGE